jgi:hypothetical protein
MRDCYKAGNGVSYRKDNIEIFPVGILPTIDEKDHVWVEGKLLGCYKCKNIEELVVTTVTSEEVPSIFLVSCVICRQTVARSEGIE